MTPELMSASIDLRPETVVDVKVRNSNITTHLGGPLTEADAGDAPAVRFEADDGRLLVVALDEDVDGRTTTHANSVSRKKRVMIPPQDFEAAFGLTREDLAARDEDFPLLAYAGDGAIVLDRIDSISVDRDRVDALREQGGT